MRLLRWAVFFCALSLSAFAQEEGNPAPRYLNAVRAELSALRLNPHCEVRPGQSAICEFRFLEASGEAEQIGYVAISDEAHSVYVYLPNLATAETDDPATPQVLQSLMSLNWRLVGSKLEWNEASGEVRISALVHTHTNFDRRAFRVLVRHLLGESRRVSREIDRIQTSNL